MDSEKRIIGFEEGKFSSAKIFNKIKNTDEIYDLLNKEGEKIEVTDFFKDDYGEPFALYYLPKDSSKTSEWNIEEDLYFTDPKKCIWWSYWKKYNRSNENQPLSPKIFFLEKNTEILECKFFWKNIIVETISKKSLWRDSYYPNTNQYVTEFDEKTIFKNITEKNNYNIFIWTQMRWDSNINIMEITELWNEFERKTHFKQAHMYYPIQKVSINEILDDSFSVNEIIENCVSHKENLISLSNLEQVKKIWNQWVYNL